MRFITEDTNKGDVKDPLSLNLYAYCVGNPIKFVDIDGHAPTIHKEVSPNSFNLNAYLQKLLSVFILKGEGGPGAGAKITYLGLDLDAKLFSIVDGTSVQYREGGVFYQAFKSGIDLNVNSRIKLGFSYETFLDQSKLEQRTIDDRSYTSNGYGGLFYDKNREISKCFMIKIDGTEKGLPSEGKTFKLFGLGGYFLVFGGEFEILMDIDKARELDTYIQSTKP